MIVSSSTAIAAAADRRVETGQALEGGERGGERGEDLQRAGVAEHVDRQERDPDQVQGGQPAVEELAGGDGGGRVVAGDDAAGDGEPEQRQRSDERFGQPRPLALDDEAEQDPGDAGSSRRSWRREVRPDDCRRRRRPGG